MRALCACLALSLVIAGPAAARTVWPDFPIIQWQPRTPAQLETLKRLGVTAGAVIADRDGNGAKEGPLAADLRAAGMQYYVENIATDFYAPYHRYTPGKSVTWLFEAAQAAYRAHPHDPALLQRTPSLSDSAWQTRIDDRLMATVRRHEHDQPLFYNLGDETGIDDLAAHWDFDTSPASIAGMQAWLRGQYPSLAALNAEWGTHYATWSAIQPELTGAAMARTDENFAQWSDFKAWMDEAFARALRHGTDAVHTADPHALAGIEGAQMPGWGGYNYTRLAGTVDVMEIYDSGENLPIVKSLNPGLIPLTTAFGVAPADLHQLWRAVLRGARGVVLWDDDNGLVQADGAPGPRAAALAPVFAALHGAFGQALESAEPVYDPVAVLYSPESFRIQWMLDHKPLGDAWMHRDAETEMEDNAYRVALRGYANALGRLGLRPRYVTPAMLAAGRLAAKVLILPDAIALSPAEARAVTAFAAAGGQVVADTQPGLFDGHGKRMAHALVPLFRQVAPADTGAVAAAMGPIHATVAVTADVPIERYLYRHGATLLLGLQTAKPEAHPITVTLTLPSAAMVRNVVSQQMLPLTRRITLTLDPVTPTLLEFGR